MKCAKVQELAGPYLDSEIDPRTVLEIQQHLAGCPECARAFAEEQQVDLRLRALLNRAGETRRLWELIERKVAEIPASAPRVAPERLAPHGILSLLVSTFIEVVRPCPRAWAALAGLWVVILSLHFSAREPESSASAIAAAPSPSEVRVALRQQQLLLAELGSGTEARSTPAQNARPPGPHSQRTTTTFRT